MARDYFHLVQQIVESTKYFDVSQQEIERILTQEGRFDFSAEHAIDDNGEEVTVTLDLHVSWIDGVTGWSVALCLHNERIDGIDFESRFRDIHGANCSGWHRHMWDAASNSCKHPKQSLGDFDRVDSMNSFLTRVLAELNIVLNKLDHGNYDLQFD